MRLLIVEDEKKVADFIARGLRAERFAVDVAGDGDSGLQMASSLDYDLIILDFSRTMIVEHVWGESFEGLTNIVDVYVRHLRAKLDDPFPAKLIRTVRGSGYSLSDAATP